jgi:hypothetical protein
MADVIDHERMLSLIIKMMIEAISLALVGNRTKRNQHIIDDQDDIGPLMADDKSFAMIELLGVFRMQTRTMLECTLHDNRHFPGQTF